tara:strand:- start:206 stop:442 length:237 start_codon:yes stop_codon:yes gene_type:complete
MNYLNTLISEKGLSRETIIEVEGKDWGMNFIPLGIVVDFINDSGDSNKSKAINNLTMIDFKGGDVMHFFKYIAKFIAK